MAHLLSGHVERDRILTGASLIYAQAFYRHMSSVKGCAVAHVVQGFQVAVESQGTRGARDACMYVAEIEILATA